MTGPNGTENTSGSRDALNWVPLLGRWTLTGDSGAYLGEGEQFRPQNLVFPMGLAISDRLMQNGSVTVRIQFQRPFAEDHQAFGIVVGYRPQNKHYVMAQLGAGEAAYSLGEFVPGFGWRVLQSAGSRENLEDDREYLLEVQVRGQELRMLVDGVLTIEYLLPKPLEGKQAGLIAAGTGHVSFSAFAVSQGPPRAFVAMQFSEPFNSLYETVILNQAKKLGFEVVRIDEKAGPGIIFQDIQREIEQADVVIGEITPTNPNVFYELGYAHALKKPTILLAQRGIQLPFDIRSYRVVFYSDSIGGKPQVEQELRKHLEAVLRQ